MYEFIANQIVGINGLINLSNVVFLVALSVRDVLKLRILAIVGEGLTLPYYYLQNEKLWPSIFWGAAFMIVNAIRIVVIALERRPVVLSDKKGEQISEAVVVMAGDLEAILSGNTRLAIRPGQLIGDVSGYSDLASPADVVARGRGTLAKWDLRHVREFTASRPELRANLLRIVSMDLAAKLRDIGTTGPSLAAEKLVSK